MEKLSKFSRINVKLMKCSCTAKLKVWMQVLFSGCMSTFCRTLKSQLFKAGQCFINFFQEETLLHNISFKLSRLDLSRV